MHTFKLVPLGLCLASFSLARAQDAMLPTTPKPRVETSLSLGTGAQLTATRVAPYYLGSQSFDPSATVLASVRQSFKPLLGYSINLGYTRSTEQNVAPQPYSGASRTSTHTNVYEVSMAYHVQKPFAPHLIGFADLGAGMLGFLPVDRGSTSNTVPFYSRAPSYLTRPLGVAAVGFDFQLSHRLSLRAEYRGHLYKYPDNQGSFARSVTETSQPTVSLVYRFGGGKH